MGWEQQGRQKHGWFGHGTTPNSDPAELRLKLSRAMLAKVGTSREEDLSVVAHRMANVMSVAELRRLIGEGIHISVARGSVTDYLSALKGVRPRGYPEGYTLDQLSGTVNPHDPKNVVIATKRGPRGERVMPGVEASSSTNILLHEIGHALNRASRFGLRSDKHDFVMAYTVDSGKGMLAAPYYHQADATAARDEAYAESHAMYLAASSQMRTEYPNLYAYWQRYYKGE